MLNFIKKLLGLGGGDEDQTPPASSQQQQSHDERLRGAVKGVEHIEGAENIRVSAGNVVRQVQGAALIHDEDDGDRLWNDTWNREVPAASWVDEWGPVQARDIDSFWHHKTEFEMACQSDPEDGEAKIKSFGYRDVGHFFQVCNTFLKHFGTPSHGNLLEDHVWDSDVVAKAAMAGAMRYQQGISQQALAADPSLLAPVEGIDLDTYASVAAKMASGLGQDQMTALLASHGMDQAKWQRVNGEWTDRMSKDTSFTITTAYSKAFGSAGAGQYGGAAQAAAATMGTGSVQAAGGTAPISFERLCEVQGAMTAWSNTGQDVNAMLKHTFGMTAQDWSSVSTWWMTQMMSNPSKLGEYSTLSDKYAAQYGANANAGADDDLNF